MDFRDADAVILLANSRIDLQHRNASHTLKQQYRDAIVIARSHGHEEDDVMRVVLGTFFKAYLSPVSLSLSLSSFSLFFYHRCLCFQTYKTAQYVAVQF